VELAVYDEEYIGTRCFGNEAAIVEHERIFISVFNRREISQQTIQIISRFHRSSNSLSSPLVCLFFILDPLTINLALGSRFNFFLTAFGKLDTDFTDRDAQLLGVSIDSEYVHLAWRGSHPDLKDLPLLHCIPVLGWKRWLEMAGVNDVAAHRGQTFDTLDLCLSAATRGQGVALGDLNLIRESLNDGVLVAPFEAELSQGIGYYLIYPGLRAQLPKIRALREWLQAAVE